MRSLAVGAALTLLAGEGASAAKFARAVSGKGFLSIPVGTVAKPHSKVKRQNDPNPLITVLENREFFYATDLEIGTPAQTVTVLVDTGSSELWVNPDCKSAPTKDQQDQCDTFGQYNPDDSTTPPIGPFGSEVLNYGDPTDESTQTSVSLRYYTDTLGFGDAEITNQTFGIVETSDGISQGIMGLAPDLVGGFDGTRDPYSLLLNTMADQGIIASRAFTLDLRHTESTTGAVIYGGLDRNKFIGTLDSRPIIRGQGGEYRLAIRLDTLGLTSDRTSDSFEVDEADQNVILDSGTTLTRLHDTAAYPILRAMGAVDDGEGYFLVPCALREAGGSVDFGFGQSTIRVPFRDFILDGEGQQLCLVGLLITEDQQILGDTVLRAGYFVFDWDNEAVHIAQAANCGDDDIVAIGSGADAVPDVTGNCDESDALFTGGSVPTATRGTSELPTGTYTTIFTVTSCPGVDPSCETGVVRTQTIEGAAPTTTSTSDDGDNGGDGNGDDDNAGVKTLATTWMLSLFGGAALVLNVL